MRATVRSEVRVKAPARAVWDYVTDWERQGEWIPMTRVEAVDAADGVGGRIRAWTGLGMIGFWDTMTITAWREEEDGAASCEVLHTGRVVRGDGEFAVVPDGPSACMFVWWERLDIPGGALGALGWRLTGWSMRKGVDAALRQLADRVEQGRVAG